jgi:hypothetical protein
VISAVPWQWDEQSATFSAEVGVPRRSLTIRWDEGDQGWFLAVIDAGRPPTMGQGPVGQRVFVTPMPLLVAMTLLPAELHEHLVIKVKQAQDASRDGHVLAHVQTAVAGLPLPWPESVKAREALESAAAAMVDVERLSLDAAAAEAWSDGS